MQLKKEVKKKRSSVPTLFSSSLLGCMDHSELVISSKAWTLHATHCLNESIKHVVVNFQTILIKQSLLTMSWRLGPLVQKRSINKWAFLTADNHITSRMQVATCVRTHGSATCAHACRDRAIFYYRRDKFYMLIEFQGKTIQLACMVVSFV